MQGVNNFAELRKLKSPNKRWLYLYEVWFDGKRVGFRRSNIEYVGCYLFLIGSEITTGRFFKSIHDPHPKIEPYGCALTFDTLLQTFLTLQHQQLCGN